MERARKTDVLAVVEIDGAMFQEAKRLFRQCDSAKLSFTDCTRFAICQKHKISEAFDRHFAMMGISLIESAVASDFD